MYDRCYLLKVISTTTPKEARNSLNLLITTTTKIKTEDAIWTEVP